MVRFLACLKDLVYYWLRSLLGFFSRPSESRVIPKSVNYHFTRQCNYSCGFCFHTATSSYVLSLGEAKRGLRLLRNAGMEKINFSGGEPFLKKEFLGALVKYSKEELSLPSVTVVSNGSLIRESWFKKYGKYLDILAISCDSFDEETNFKIGRSQGSKAEQTKLLYKIRDWCEEYRVLFKINTVVNRYNVDEDVSESIINLNPVRWKVFQCLLLEGENSGDCSIKTAEEFYIPDEEFDKYIRRHQHVPCLVPESNKAMKDSYLILDEKMRFLNCQTGGKIPSQSSILEVGVEKAITQAGFDEKMFNLRGGVYNWTKNNQFDW